MTSSYGCELCSKVYSAVKILYRHQRKEHGDTFTPRVVVGVSVDTLIQCPDCDITCKYKTELARHSALVHARNNKCDVCNKVFASGVDLQRHNAFVHGATTVQGSTSRAVLPMLDVCARLQAHKLPRQST